MLTRDGDRTPQPRGAHRDRGSRSGGDLFVSLHANAAPAPLGSQGIETYYLDANHERHSLRRRRARERRAARRSSIALQRTLAKLRVSEVSAQSRRARRTPCTSELVRGAAAAAIGEVARPRRQEGARSTCCSCRTCRRSWSRPASSPTATRRGGCATRDYLDDAGRADRARARALPRRERDARRREARRDARRPRSTPCPRRRQRPARARPPAASPGVRQLPGRRARSTCASCSLAGAVGPSVNETHSDLIDRLVRRLFELAEARRTSRAAPRRTSRPLRGRGGRLRAPRDEHPLRRRPALPVPRRR